MAAAHGDTGLLELVDAHAVDDDSVTYTVELVYERDGDPVSTAEVVVSTDNVAPQVMTAEGGGRYVATVDFPTPGDYPVLFTVEDPSAELVHDQSIAVPTTATTTTAITTAVTDGQPLTLATDHDDANGTWLLIVMTVIIVAMMTIAVAFFRSRRGSASNRPST